MSAISATAVRPWSRGFILSVLVMALAGCHWLAGDEELLTRAEYISTQQRQQLVLEDRLRTMQDELERRFQRQEERLVVLDRRVLEVREEQAAAADQTVDEDAQGSDDDRADPVILSHVPTPDEKLILGSAECVTFPQQGLVLRARVDSGAATSSLHAIDIDPFERDGDAWVRFGIPAPGAQRMDAQDEESTPTDDDPIGVVTEVEAEIEREVRIRQTTGKEQRYVVSLPIRIGSLAEAAEFTLTDRADMDQPVLLGRRLIRDIALIDVAREYVQPCSVAEE